MAATTKAAGKAAKAPVNAAAKAGSGSSRTRNATAAKKAPVKRNATAAKAPAATKKAPAKKAAAKRAPAKAAKKSPAKKAPAKAGAKRAPAKKAPAKAAATRSSSRTFPPQIHVKKAPPKRKGPLDKFLLGQLAALEAERVTYTRQAASLKAEADLLAAEREPGDVQFDEESGEGDTLAVERERDLALSAQASAAVEEIDLAIAKIREGTYGVCEQCNSTIPKERLRALPYAALCVQCKSAGFSRR